ncbi:MAG: hypothetical protein Q8O40_09965 [Chloroflexota bacterium]|nr:hypothetical protein [Chloroflexota bacterium]
MATKRDREEREAMEDEELTIGLDEAVEEWEREGGIEASELFRQLKAERKAKGRTSELNL